MNKHLRLTLVGLFFALMFTYAGTKGYQALTVASSDVGWGPRQADGRVVVIFCFTLLPLSFAYAIIQVTRLEFTRPWFKVGPPVGVGSHGFTNPASMG